MNQNEFDKKLIDRVEKAAEKGAREGSGGNRIRNTIIAVAVAVALFVAVLLVLKHSIEKKWSNFEQEIKAQLTFTPPAETHDMVVEDKEVLGYTAADFADVVLGDSSRLKKMEVYEAKISDAVTLTETGLGNLSIFTKTQMITYNGTATYTVDLSKITEDNILVDEGEKVVIMYIPHATCGFINIPSHEMEFGDTERGWLAFGDIEMTAEQSAKVESEARIRMWSKLQELNTAEDADRFAKMTIWEMYQPLISSVSPEYQLSVRFWE